MKTFKFSKSTNTILIILPGVLFLLAVIFTTDIVFPPKVDTNFVYNDGKIGGSRWFSYKYESAKFFSIKSKENTGPVINKTEISRQIPIVAKARGYSETDVALLQKLVDSLLQYSDKTVNGEKAVNIILLNVSLEELK
jgi:K+-transporting ATPase c subunit